MENIYKMYVGLDKFVSQKILNDLKEKGFNILVNSDNLILVSKIADENYDKQNEEYVISLIKLQIKRMKIDKAFNKDISDEMKLWISKAKKAKDNTYKVYENNWLMWRIRNFIMRLYLDTN